jgi:hypothetical protein
MELMMSNLLETNNGNEHGNKQNHQCLTEGAAFECQEALTNAADSQDRDRRTNNEWWQ